MSPRIIVGMAITLAASGGCNAIAGIEEPREPGTSSGTSSGTVIDVARFVGTWSASGQTASENCSQPGFAYSEPQSYTFKVTRAGDNGIVVENQNSDFRNEAGGGLCSVPLTISGSTASVRTPTTCRFSQATASGTVTYTTATTWSSEGDVLDVRAGLLFDAGARCDYRASFTMSRTPGGGGT